MSRTFIYKDFRELLDKNKVSLKQQLFLERYVEKYYKVDDIIDRLLIYHGIGTGKTRTSIIIAEKIMKINPKMKAIIILPARLKTNYIDELIPIICSKFINELKKYNDPKITSLEKKKLLIFFNEKIDKNYLIYSYEYIINLFKKSSNIKKTLEVLTKNKILIIDEFHNLISNGIKEKTINDINIKNKLPTNPKLIRALIMRYISRFADKSCKMFFLTATPVFDNYLQFIELVKLLNPKQIDNKKLKSIKDIIPYINGKVSYYSINDKKDFPVVEYSPEKIPLSSEQDIKMFKYQEDTNSQDSETFLLKQRQLAISVYGYDKVDLVLSDLKKYAPKLNVLFKYLSDKKDGKHLIYSNFITYCLHIIQKYLNNNGWINYTDRNKSKIYQPYKTYILWDATLSDYDKQYIKTILNSKSNIDGKIIKVILGSPSIKEGISFKHIQHFHQIDPVWNISAKQQIEGRCIRYKSHDDIPLNHKYLKKKVIIHNYISIPLKGGNVKKTCDEIIYNDIMPKKEVIVNKLLTVLQKVAIDYYLYKKISTSPKSSSIYLTPDDILKPQIARIKGLRNTCPVKRRPIDNKCEKEGYEIRPNPQKFDCCYYNKDLKNKGKTKKENEKKNGNNDYINERIKIFNAFLKIFNKNKMNKCKTDNINNLTIINENLRLWTVFKANISKIPVIITLTYLQKNLLLINTIKELSNCVIQNYSPHYQLYYNEVNCSNISIYKKLLNDKSSSQLSSQNNYDITFYENLYYHGNLYEFIMMHLININDKLFINIFTQCIFSIMFYYSYFSYKNDEFISLEGILGQDFICHRIEKGGYFKYELYGKDYYLENLGFVFVLSFINKNSKNNIIKSKNNFDVIFSFIKTIKLFIDNITQYFQNKNNNFMEKLLISLERCNNTKKQLPDKLLEKTINSISNHIIIKDFFVVYKSLLIKSNEVINPNTPYIISKTYI
jgi:hypothetical protein